MERLLFRSNEGIFQKQENQMNIQEAKSEEEISKCFEVIHGLRPHLIKENFVSLILTMMNEGYRLAYIEIDGKAVSAIGFRYLQFLHAGKHFYIDDLTTLPQYRGKGYGSRLLDFVFELGRNSGLKKITLDSGDQRFDAHRLYLNKGFKISSHHFVKEI